MSEYLNGVAVAFYRGIGPNIQRIAPFSKMNFFVGSNNSGKSIILNLISNHVPRYLREERVKPLDPVEVYKGTITGNIKIAIGRKKEQIFKEIEKKIYEDREVYQSHHRQLIEKELKGIINDLSEIGLIWKVITEESKGASLRNEDINEISRWDYDWNGIWSMLTRQTGGSRIHHWVPETIDHIAGFASPKLPPVHLIPAKRQLGEKGETFTDLSGRGLIDHLATLQNPSYDKQSDREKYRKINSFIREVTGNHDAVLEVPSEREHLLVHMNNKVLPLSSLGTGIHEVILIAAFCTIHDGSIMCIEEPEIHLHPILQKKLIRFLAEKTSSQYFIATHSSAFIDARPSSIFHVENDGSQTYVRSAITSRDKRKILDDLGCYASDILQANSIIWVEGPSDRIYVRHWIQAVDERLVEGIHYTIMFYGGALLRHLSASDEAVDEFIKLRLLNRNMAIVIDSDRESETDALKPHAARIAKELSEGDGIAWVTAGREVENYVDFNKLQEALKSIHPKLYLKSPKGGRFEHAFYFYRTDPNNPDKSKIYPDADKVGVANIICAVPANLEVLDLRERVSELVQMIRKANGLE